VHPFPRALLVLLASLPFAFTGCTLSRTAAPSPEAGLAMQGKVMGGQQPIVGAHVYLFAANTTGYGGAGIAASASNASVSLLTNVPGSTTLDTSGGATNGDYYVTSGTGGTFSITGDYSCTPNQQVYLYALGGNPGLTAGTNNAAAGLLAVLGNCPSSGNFLGAAPFVFMNEVSTIAAAYAFAGFATDATHVSSSGTALAQVGIANAFANAGNLEALSTGLALTTTPAGNGTVPQREMDTLANILGSCINSNGSIAGPTTPTACYTLLNGAQSNGNSGIVPADTATAAIIIAHNPGANIAALYGLQTASAPFQPGLVAAPNDFIMAVYFNGVGTSAGLAIDGLGDVWIANVTYGSVTKLSSTGVVLSPGTGYGGGGLSDPTSIAIDSFGNAWVPNSVTNGAGILIELSSAGGVLSGTGGYSGGGLSSYLGPIAIDGLGDVWIGNSYNTVTEFSSGGTPISGPAGYGGGNVISPQSIAIDSAGDVWIGDRAGNWVTELSGAGVVLSGAGFTEDTSVGPTGVAIDGSGDVWVSNLGNSISELTAGGRELSPAGGYTGGGLSNPGSIALDGAGNAWASNVNTGIAELSNSGVALSPSTGYTGSTGSTALADVGVGSTSSVAVDGSGDVWAAGNGRGVVEFVGAATPVVTPLVVGVKNNTLGTRT
jgi:hypothetical protein